MRDLINLIEAISHLQSTFWYNPATKEVVPCSDHGEAVENNPEKFDISWQIVVKMEKAWPYGSDENEDTDHETSEEADEWFSQLPAPPAEVGPRQGNDRNNCWERLGMNRGWVRVGLAVSLSNTGTAAYFSSSTPQAIWQAVRYVHQNGSLGDKIEIELCPDDGGQGSFAHISGDDLVRYLKNGHRYNFQK